MFSQVKLCLSATRTSTCNKVSSHLLSTYFLGFYNYRGEVTNDTHLDIYHGDEDSSNFAGDNQKANVRKKKSKAVVSTVDWSPSRQAKLAKIDPIDFCRAKASSSKTSSTPSTKIVRKPPKTFARNSEKHFWTEKIDIQQYNFESTNRKYKSKLVLLAKTKVSEVLTQVWKADWDPRPDSRGDGQVRRHSRHLKCWLQISRSPIPVWSQEEKPCSRTGTRMSVWMIESDFSLN